MPAGALVTVPLPDPSFVSALTTLMLSVLRVVESDVVSKLASAADASVVEDEAAATEVDVAPGL